MYSPKLSFSKFNEEWFVGFEKEQIRQGQRINTIQDKVKVLKKITAICLREGKISASPFENYKGKTEPGTREFLNKSEFLSLCNLDGLSKGHEIVRDVFVFGCFTGLRFSDMCTLSSDQINTETDADGKMDYRISIRMQKTKGLLTLKLAKGAIRIIREYGYPNEESVLPILKFPSSKYLTETALKEAISSRNAYFNKVIKQLCAKADIKKHISMHCSRHTFATLSLDLDIPIQVVSKMLGHKNLKATMIYAKIMDKQKDAAIDAWDNL